MRRSGLRLLPAAATAWVAAAGCVMVPTAALAVAASAGLAALAMIVVLLRTAAEGRRRRVLVITIALGTAAAVATTIAWAQPVRDAAAAWRVDGGRALVAEVTVTGKLDRTAIGFRADAVVQRVEAGVEEYAGPVPVVLLLDEAPAGLDMGSRARVRTTAFPAGDAERAVLVLDVESVEESTGPAGVLAATAWLRERMLAATDPLPSPGAGLVAGLAVGDTRAVTAELETQMTTASLTHLVAVSGANCALVVGAGYGLGALLALRRGTRVGVAALLLTGFVLLVTPEPSVVRAATMAAVAMVALLTGREAAGVAVLCAAVTVLLIVDPWLAFELGFALSVAATAALLTLARPLAAGLGRWMPRWLALALSVPLAAQLACGPLIVLIAPSLSTYGVLANLLAGPAAPVATILGVLGCLAALVPPLQTPLLWLAWVPASWIAAVAETAAALPGALLPWPEGVGGAAWMAAAGAVVALAIAVPGPRRWMRGAGVVARGAAVAFVGCLAGTIVLGTVAAPATVPSPWAVAACDIGQGDALVVRSAGRAMLIDTGPDPEPLLVCLRRLGVERLDLLVLTHFDHDHVGAAAALAGRVDVLVHGPMGEEDAHIVASVGASEVLVAHAGMSGLLGDASWRVLWPTASPGFEVGNDTSAVVEIEGGGVPRALFLGDLGADAQRTLAASGALRPPYEIVKVSHHGSADQDPGLYRLLEARIALVSVGVDNGYGHPRQEILDVLAAAGAAVARTDHDGLVLVGVDGAGALTWWRERAPP